MQNGIDYKAKYADLRARFVKSLDVAFQAGYQKGSQDAAQQQMVQQAQQMQAQQAQMQQMMQQSQQPQSDLEAAAQQGPEQPQDQGETQQSDQQSQDQMGQGSELDSHINELEDLVSKSEPSMDDIKKSIAKIKGSHLHRAVNLPTKSASYHANMSSDAKATLSMQDKIVSDIFKKWEHESDRGAQSIMQALNTEVLSKTE